MEYLSCDGQSKPGAQMESWGAADGGDGPTSRFGPRSSVGNDFVGVTRVCLRGDTDSYDNWLPENRISLDFPCV